MYLKYFLNEIWDDVFLDEWIVFIETQEQNTKSRDKQQKLQIQQQSLKQRKEYQNYKTNRRADKH